MIIALVNHSVRLKNESHAFSAMAQAITQQLKLHAAPAWDRSPQMVISTQSPTGAQRVITVMDTPDTEGALGYHTEDKGVIYGEVFTDPIYEENGTLLTGSLSVAAVLSHEVLEMWADPFVNYWVEDGTQHEWPLELCDAVQDGIYQVKTSLGEVSVSNFIYPAYFDAENVHGPYDYLHTLTKPFTIAHGGYSVRRKAGTGAKEIFGAVPAWKAKMHGLRTKKTRSTKRRAGNLLEGTTHER